MKPLYAAPSHVRITSFICPAIMNSVKWRLSEKKTLKWTETWNEERLCVSSVGKVSKKKWRYCSQYGRIAYMHCSHVGPHLGTRVPMGTFFRFWVPIGSPFFFKVPIFSISGLRTRENSVQPPSNVDHLIIQCKWHKHCALNEDTLCLCEYFLFKKKLASSMN